MLAHCPKAMVAMSGLMTSMVSRMEMMEYACPPARSSHWNSVTRTGKGRGRIVGHGSAAEGAHPAS